MANIKLGTRQQAMLDAAIRANSYNCDIKGLRLRTKKEEEIATTLVRKGLGTWHWVGDYYFIAN